MAFQKDTLTVAGLKMLAKDLRTALEDVTGVAIPAHQAQEVAARQFGYPTWHAAYAQAKRVSAGHSPRSTASSEPFKEVLLKGVRELTRAQLAKEPQRSLADRQLELAQQLGYASWEACLAATQRPAGFPGSEPEWLVWAKMSLARGQAWTDSFLKAPEQQLKATLVARNLDSFWRQVTEYDQGVRQLAPLVVPKLAAQAHKLGLDAPTQEAWVQRTQQPCLYDLIYESLDHDPSGTVFARLWDHLESGMDAPLRRDLIRYAIECLAPLDHLIRRQEEGLREYDDEFFVENAIVGAHDETERQRVERLLTLNSDPDKLPHALAHAALELDEAEAPLLIGHLVHRFVPVNQQRAMLTQASKKVDQQIAERGLDVLWQSHETERARASLNAGFAEAVRRRASEPAASALVGAKPVRETAPARQRRRPR